MHEDLCKKSKSNNTSLLVDVVCLTYWNLMIERINRIFINAANPVVETSMG